MTRIWCKVDVAIGRHPKVAMAGPFAELLYRRSIEYCREHLTDGVLPAAMVPALIVWPAGHRIPGNEALADRLVAVGLWHREGDGFAVHDFLAYQESKADVAARSAEMSRRGSNGARKRHGSPPSTPLSEPPSSPLGTEQADGLAAATVFSSRGRGRGREREEIGIFDPSSASPTPGDSLALVPARPAPNGLEASRGDAGAIDLIEARFRSYGHTLRPTAKSPHRTHIRARLAEGWSPDDLALAVDGNHLDAWHAKVAKHELAYVFRNSEQVARFVDVAKQGGQAGQRDMASAIEREQIVERFMREQGGES